MAYSNIVLQPALHVWTCLNVYIVKYTFPWNQDLAINAPQVIPQISSLLYQRITLWWQRWDVVDVLFWVHLSECA